MKIRDALPCMIMSSLVNARNADGKANQSRQHTTQARAGESRREHQQKRPTERQS